MSPTFLAVTLPPEAQSGIEGVVTISPWHHPGPVKADEPAAKPLTNATFVVQDQKEAVAAEITTDAQGGFRVALAPGHKVSLKNRKSSIGKFGPFEVDVAAGKMTSVQWNCDTGMR